jgi:hypothetical protein
MNENVFLIREESIPRLKPLVAAIWEAARRADPDEGRVGRALSAALAGECARCRTRVTGAELLELARLPADQAPDPQVARLRRGRCANDQCLHSSYRLILRRHPDLDWSRLLSQAGTPPGKTVDPVEPELVEGTLEEPAPSPAPAATPAPRRHTLLRAGVLVAAVFLLLLVRQWYYGGRIPLLREPENFRVDSLPAGMTNEKALLQPPRPSRARKP